MSDLIKRLRMGTQVPEFELRQEAADEIERLTKGWEGLEYETSAQIASLAAAVNTMHKEAIEQEKHIAKLQAALKEIRDVARCSDGVDFYAMLAEQALEGDDG
jgi:hypothetical protein